MACIRCGSACQGRYCPTHALEASHEGVEETEGTQRTLAALGGTKFGRDGSPENSEGGEGR